MTSFELPATEGKPLDIIDFKVDLQTSPPNIQERIIEKVDPYVITATDAIKINYKDANIKEGNLNIYVCRFATGRYRLHIFGCMTGKEFRTEREIPVTGSHGLQVLND